MTNHEFNQHAHWQTPDQGYDLDDLLGEMEQQQEQ